MYKFLLFVFFIETLTGYQITADKTTTPLLSPTFKEQSTLKITLDNGLKAYIITDPHAEHSAITLSVRAGSWNEPIDQPGLAHFLEHMIFMGTKSHPDEAFFTSFIKEHGGQSNAYTEDLYTTYVYDIDSSALEESLQLFSEFFKEPLLSKDSSNREIQAITQEFQGRSSDDDSRRLMVYKELASQEHPWHRFNYGNKESLKNASVDDLKSFFQKYYISSRMHVIVYTSIPAKEVAAWLEKDFNSLNGKTVTDESRPAIFNKEFDHTLTYIEPINHERSIAFLWELPKTLAASYDSRPEEILCYTLGHETKNTLLDILRKEGLALELSCGAYRWNFEQMIFLVEIELTDKGLEKKDQVIELLFSALHRLQKEALPSYIFSDYQAISKLRYQWPVREKPFDMVFTLSRGLRYENLDTFPEKMAMVQTMDQKLYQELLDVLTPKSVHIDLMAKNQNLHFDKKERWMGVNYKVTTLSPDFIKTLENAKPLAELELPPPNPFLPKNFSHKTASQETVTKILENERGIFYLAPDHLYQLPKISLKVQIDTPLFNYTSSEHVVYGELFIKMVERSLLEKSYEAKLAGLEYELKYDDKGLYLTLQGFSDQAKEYLEKILDNFHPVYSEEQFKNVKDALLLSWYNEEAPYKQAVQLLREAIYEHYYSAAEKREVLKEIDSAQFSTYLTHLFDNSFITSILYGNSNENDAKELFTILQEKLPGKPYTERSTRKVGVLKKGVGPLYLEDTVTAKGNALLLAIQDGEFSFKELVSLQLLSTLMEDPFFQELRAKQQTAYLISSSEEIVEDKLYALFILESHTHDPRDLLARVELFLESFINTLPDNQKQFESAKIALLNQLSTPPHSFEETVKLLQKELFDYHADFAWQAHQYEALKALTFQEFQILSENMIGRKNHKRLAIMIRGKTEALLQYSPAPSMKWIHENELFE